LPAVTGTRLHLYGLWHQAEGLLGATPEILFQWDESRVLHSVAVAGTLAKSPETPRETEALRLEAFLSDPKELWEHELVIRGIQQALEPFGNLKIGKTSALELPALYHLHTPIELPLPADRDFNDVVQALHPTPALGAWPRLAGGAWLRELEEKMPRRRYGAPFGIVSDSGQARCWVAIRNIQWNADQLSVGAGCGVVAGSSWQKEWGELQAKLQSIHRIFGI